MGKKKINSRAIGLEIECEFAKWLTGKENMHYGLWTGLEVNAQNLGAAQVAYTDKLFGYLPDGPLSILDIGGGAGETAKRLISLGHRVEIVVPSDYLAARCRENAPEAKVHESTFEDFNTDQTFDLCLFSESFQYIPLNTALNKALSLTKANGHILIADCFRSAEYAKSDGRRPPGGGHRVAKFEEAIETLPVSQIAQEDITEAVAPSIDLEQALFHVFGTALSRTDVELTNKRPMIRRFLLFVLRLIRGKGGLQRLNERLRGNFRTSEVFERNNRYLITLLQKLP